MKPAKSGSQDCVGNSAYRALVLAGLLTAFLLRLYRLGAASLWYDETVSAYLANQSFSDIIAHTALDIHPPGYYLLLHVWSLVSAPLPTLGLEFLLAFPSLWFGVLTVALLAPLGRTLLGKAPAALAVWLAAFSPFLIWYGQEVRMYTAASALCLVCLLAALRFTAHVDRRPAPTRNGRKGWRNGSGCTPLPLQPAYTLSTSLRLRSWRSTSPSCIPLYAGRAAGPALAGRLPAGHQRRLRL